MVAAADAFAIVAEQPGFLVVHKGPGLDVHDCDGVPGLCSVVRSQTGLPVFPVHRLDKPTSGLLLLATDRSMAARLAGLFRERTISKYYVALTDLKPARKQGLVCGDMARSRRGSWKLLRTCVHPARTRFLSWSVRPGLRLVVLRPLTGRTHQLRVAMKSLGSPIVGDTLYHACTADRPDRLYLHAHTLRFTLDGREHVYACPPRQGELFVGTDVEGLLRKLGPLQELPWPKEALETI